MEDYETNILFEHTKRLREGRLLLEQQEDGRQSESSGSSDAMSESQTPWFQRCWSVQPGKVDTSQAAGSKRPPLQPTTVVTEMHGGSIAPTDNENVQPFSRHKVRSWRQNFDIATSNPTLKRVVQGFEYPRLHGCTANVQTSRRRTVPYTVSSFRSRFELVMSYHLTCIDTSSRMRLTSKSSRCAERETTGSGTY
jgi:hypothetical protein